MRKRTLLAALTAMVLALAAAGPVQAQVSFSYGRGYGYGGFSYGSPWFGYGRYYGPYAYRGGFYPDYGYGYYPYRGGISISVGAAPYYGYGYYPRSAGFTVEAPVYRLEPRAGDYRAAYQPSDNRATVRVTLPTPDAKVWFEDTLTEQEGRTRTFLTPELDADSTYTYVVKATWKQDGREMTQEKEVRVRAGAESTVAFHTRPAPGRDDSAAGAEPRELGDLDRPAKPPAPARDVKPQPKRDVPPPPE